MTERATHSISVEYQRPPATSWVDLDAGIAYFEPIVFQQPDLGPLHIRSIKQLQPGQTVEILTLCEGYQQAALFVVDALRHNLEAERDAANRVVLTEIAGIDCAGAPVVGTVTREMYASDLGLEPYRDESGNPVIWNSANFLMRSAVS